MFHLPRIGFPGVTRFAFSVLRLIGAVALLLTALAHAQSGAQPVKQTIRLSTTTSTENSGLLAYLLPSFEAKTGIRVNVIAVGTGKALELAKNGDVDVTLVHARAAEDAFVAAGYGVQRHDVMYNDFVLVGPESDPAGIRGSRDVLNAMRQIAHAKVKFISRGDNSGTDQMEKSYWKSAGVMPSPTAYLSAGMGMGEVLQMAAQMDAYTMTDRATYSSYKAKTGLTILVEGDRRMFNPYGIIAVSPERIKDVHYNGAMALIKWLTSLEGQAKIAAFKVDGQQVFFPASQALR